VAAETVSQMVYFETNLVTVAAEIAALRDAVVDLREGGDL
jgi:hypothetical protein